jgi:hypothetical protein
MMLVFPPDASAALITYTFSNDASITFSDGNVEDVSGSFVLNTTGGVVSNADITLSGNAPEAGTYDANPFYDTSNRPTVCGSPSGDIPILCVWFQAPLDGSTVALIASPPSGIGYFPTDPGINVTETTVTGDISSDAPLPEPSSLALFAGAVGLFGLRRRLGKSRPAR